MPRTEAPFSALQVDGEKEVVALPSGYHDVPYDMVPTSRRRRLIAEHMVRSRTVAAHMTTEVEVDMTSVTRARAAINVARAATDHVRISFLPFVAYAAIQALQEFPNLNATFAEERLIRWRSVNLGIAVDTEEGLIVPVVRNADDLNVAGLAERISVLADSAHRGALSVDDIRGGTFTISNPGSAGAVSAMAIINQPQVAILGMPAIVKRPVCMSMPSGEDIIAIRPMMPLALTFDHRAVDGAEATRAAVAIKGRLEGWPT
jgi:2-oxoglutarate dehydrogenase E2 component (dihydrolipoamide succinyltransferase)